MRLALVAAVSDNGIIGRDGALPWHLPADLRHFRRITMGKPVIMGRKTYESIGRPLPGRANIVLSRDPGFAPQGVRVVRDLDEALRQAEAIAEIDGVDEVIVIGGGELYARSLAQAQRIYLTRVHATVSGDALFPQLDPAAWRVLESRRHRADDSNCWDFTLQVLERVEP